MQENLLGLVEQADVVGAGGAGFPTHVKLRAQANTIIINGVECEPLLRVDQQLMALQAGDLLDALDLLVEQVGASRDVVALKKCYHAAVEALERGLSRHPRLRIYRMGASYPVDDEQVIVYEVTGRVVSERGVPLDVSVVVSNMETTLNVLMAIRHQVLVTEKYVTLTDVMHTLKTVKVPLGIAMAEVLVLVGGLTVEHYEVINGGPMVGCVVSTGSAITKTTKRLIVVPEGHPLLQSLNRSVSWILQDARMACIQYSLRPEVCPWGLLGHRIQPHKIMRLATYDALCNPEYTLMNAFLCCGCRLCEYACTMGLQPQKLNRMLKDKMGKKGVRNVLHNQSEVVTPFWQYKRYPVHKLIHRLGLDDYDVPAPVEDSFYDY